MFWNFVFILFYSFVANSDTVVFQLQNALVKEESFIPRIVSLEVDPVQDQNNSQRKIIFATLQDSPCDKPATSHGQLGVYDCKVTEDLISSVKSKVPDITISGHGYFLPLDDEYILINHEEITSNYWFCKNSDCLEVISRMYLSAGMPASSNAYLIPAEKSCQNINEEIPIHSFVLPRILSPYVRRNFPYVESVEKLKREFNVIRSSLVTDLLVLKVCGCFKQNCTVVEDFTGDLGRLHSPPIIAKEFRQLQDAAVQSQLAASNQVDNTANTPPTNTFCNRNADCMGGMGICENSICRGFIPDINGDRVFSCPQNFRCDFGPGIIPGVNIDSNFSVIAIPPGSRCGVAPPLAQGDSVFLAQNKWSCSDQNSSSCVFSAGTTRLTGDDPREGVRLCGCPNIDSNENRINCDMDRDFYVNLGMVVVQECFINAHCADRQFAQCVEGKCSNADGLLSGTSLKLFKCVTSQNCSFRTITQRAFQEAMKVVQITENEGCGSQIGLSPEALTDAMLPCVLDVDDDGICEVNLGIPERIGRTRLCVCEGDKGGNGVPCDQPEDFDNFLGFVSVQECIVDSDCSSSVCISEKCVVDSMPPKIVSSFPGNETSVVPPLNKLTITWNEDVFFTNSGNLIVLECKNCKKRWTAELSVLNETNVSQSMSGYSIKLDGRNMEIIPTITSASIPEGLYDLYIPENIVKDGAGNTNAAAVVQKFSVSRTADCPLLYITGFSSKGAVISGLYASIDTVNKHPAWVGSAGHNYYIFWKPAKDNKPATWVVSKSKDSDLVKAYLDVEKMKDKDYSYKPISGQWKKWNDVTWETHPDIIVHCASQADKLSPQLVFINPLPNTHKFPVENGEIKLFFNEPVHYGQWATFKLTSSDGSHEVTIYPDYEKRMRRKYMFADGTDQVTIIVPEKLRSGTTYHITTTNGFVTDLAFNPWGAVEKGVLNFTTYGIPCSPVETSLPNMNWNKFTVVAQYTEHLGNATLGCKAPMSMVNTEGLIPQEIQNNQIVLQCVDGEWSDVTASCRLPCSNVSHMLSPSVYTVENELPVNLHGTNVSVRCTPNTVLISGTGFSTLQCNDGVWTDLNMECAASCGKFPPLGPAYQVDYDTSKPSSLSTIIGSRRIVRCVDDAEVTAGTSPTVVVCEEQGWSPINLQCHMSCEVAAPLTEAYAIDEGVSNSHGSAYRLKCAPGYQGFSDSGASIDFVYVECIEGKWIQNETLDCIKSCKRFPAGLAYTVKDIKGNHGDHKSEIEVSCAPYATSKNLNTTNTAQIVRCNYGLWDYVELDCYAACEAPVNTLKQVAYDYFVPSIYDEEIQSVTVIGDKTIYHHLTKAYLLCSPSSLIEDGLPPEPIMCYNGQWYRLPELQASMKENSVILKPPQLQCSAPCTNFSKGLIAYTTITPLLPENVKLSNFIDDQEESSWLVPSGTVGEMRCKQDYTSTTGSDVGRFICRGGMWVEENPAKPFECKASCDLNRLPVGLENSIDFVELGRSKILNHNERVAVNCRSRFFWMPSYTQQNLYIVCNDGQLEFPENLICELATCSDRMQNGFETAVDCGDQCRTCNDCDLGLPSCNPSCNDGVRNGFEEFIDCGGNCEPCIPCQGLPPRLSNNISLLLDGTTTWVPYDSRLSISSRTFPPYQKIYGSCRKYSPTESFNYITTYTCIRGQWSASNPEHLTECEATSCFNFKQDGLETGVDCGGNCLKQCGTCYDGIQNGTEEGVDCGGLQCLPCSACQTTFLKGFSSNVMVTEVLNDPTSNVELETTTMTKIQHGTTLAITCKGDPLNQTAMVQCKDGNIEPLKQSINIYDLKCNSLRRSAAEDLLQTVGLFQLPMPSSCTDNTCCSFAKEFNSVMSSECGALLFSNNPSQVAGFCEGKCFSQLKHLVREKYIGSTSRSSECLQNSMEVTEKLLTQFCFKEKSEYCFAKLQETLDTVNAIDKLSDLPTQSVCGAKSCFRQNLVYLEILSSLNSMFSSSFPTVENRNLRDVSNNITTLSKFSQKETSFSDHYLAQKVFKSNDFLRNQLSSPFIKQWFNRLKYTEKFLNLLCLHDYENQSCQSVTTDVLKFVQSNNPSEDSKLSWMFKDSVFCRDSCYGIVVRHIGQTLINEGSAVNQVSPYKAHLGVLLRTYGRIACERDSNGTNCVSIFGSAFKMPLQPYSAVRPRQRPFYRECNKDPTKPRCPESFIGDDQCDPECFRPECGYDEHDCDFENMFPLTYQRLIAKNPIDDNCHPFHNMFTCTPIPNFPNCHEKITGTILEEGCCAAARWDLLREVLRYNAELRDMVENPNNIHSLAPATALYPSTNLDRSPSWIEATCKVALDRTCASGIKRNVIQAQYRIQKIKYEEIFYEAFRDVSYAVVSKAVRESVSNTLAIPRYDITEIRFWPEKTISIEIVIDPGLHANEVLHQLRELRASKQMVAILRSSILKSLIYINEMKKSYAHNNRRLQETLDFDDLDDIDEYVEELDLQWVNFTKA